MRTKEDKQKEQVAEVENREAKPERAERRLFSAQQKVEAVLAIWSGSRTPSEVCEELDIAWGILSGWEDRALKAVLDALQPRRRPEEERGPILPSRLEQLLEKTRAGVECRLDKKLRRVQKEPEPAGI